MIVLDTHVVLWITQAKEKLSKPARLALAEGRRAGGLSIADITLQEIASAVIKGQVVIDKPLDVYLTFVESVFNIVPINGRIAERSMQFGKTYPKDPADRLIGATAIVLGATLVTRDGLIRASGEVNCIW